MRKSDQSPGETDGIIVVIITVEVMVQIIVNGYQEMRDKRKKRLDKMTDKRFGEERKSK